jgi:hypothetical protein
MSRLGQHAECERRSNRTFSRVHGVGEAEPSRIERTPLGVGLTSFLRVEGIDRRELRLRRRQLSPQHPRALGVRRRSRGEQRERDEQ